MNILKPSTWFAKAPKAAPSHVFLQLSPERPHQGIDHFSADAKCVYKYALKVTGVSQDEARLNLVGKVLDWDRLTEKQIQGIEGGKSPEIEYTVLKGMFR